MLYCLNIVLGVASLYLFGVIELMSIGIFCEEENTRLLIFKNRWWSWIMFIRIVKEVRKRSK